MSVAGYNVDAESGDPIVGIEIEGDKACLYIDEGHSQTEIKLSRNELTALISQSSDAIDRLDWDNAEWLYAKGLISTDKYHLVRKGEHDPQGKVLCGKLPPCWFGKDSDRRDWDFSPVLGDPIGSSVCKSCSAKWQKLSIQPQ